MTGIEKRITGIEKKLTEIEDRRAKEMPPLRVIWEDIETGEQTEPIEPGTWVIEWGAGDEIVTYRHDPSKPNGGRPDKKRKGG